MANSQLPPRQKMINMMYLVLTAILALTVSQEVLDAFKNVNDGINVSNSSLQNKNAETFSQFERQNAIDSGRVRIAFEKAGRARQLSQKLYNLLEQYKQQMTAEAGGIDAETGKIKRDDDIDVPTRIFVEDNGNRGRDLKKQIEETRRDLLALVEEPARSELDKSFALKLEAPKDGQSWEFATFNHVPVIAAVTTLTKYQNDVLTAEAHIIDQLYSSVYKQTDVVDRMEAKIISPTSYILQGESYKADVMVAASNSTLVPEVFLGSFTQAVKKSANGGYEMIESGSDALPLLNPTKIDVSAGLGKLNLPGAATGDKKYTGVIRMKSKTGTYKFYPFEGEYQVAPKVAVVSPTKMNVVYIGLDNPVDLSVPGVAQSDVIATVEGDGVLQKNSDGSYFFHVKNRGNTKIKLSARIDGKVLAIGEQVFRIKRVPDPLITLDGNLTAGPSKGTIIEGKSGVVARSDDFPYGDVPWRVLSYKVSVRKKGDEMFESDNPGPGFNGKSKGLLKGLGAGSMVFVDDIKVLGPDGATRTVPSIAFNITVR